MDNLTKIKKGDLVMQLEENKYYICSNKTSSDDLLYTEGFSDIEDAIIKAREIANQDTSSYCIYIQPTDRQEQVELVNYHPPKGGWLVTDQ